MAPHNCSDYSDSCNRSSSVATTSQRCLICKGRQSPCAYRRNSNLSWDCIINCYSKPSKTRLNYLKLSHQSKSKLCKVRIYRTVVCFGLKSPFASYVLNISSGVDCHKYCHLTQLQDWSSINNLTTVRGLRRSSHPRKIATSAEDLRCVRFGLLTMKACG